MNLSITFDIGTKLDLMAVVDRQVFPLLAQAVNAVGKSTANNWQQAVYAAKLWSGEKDDYAKSISWKMTGDFSGEVEATYGYAKEIEDGRPAFDMKGMLATSSKVKMSKKGIRYLSIPFRHNTPSSGSSNAMPSSVYDIAKILQASMVTGMGSRQSGQKGMGHLSVPQASYQWGGRLPAGLSEKYKPSHATDLHAGMVRFNATSPSGAKSSVYLTFRTMSEKSKGWIKPAKDGLKLAEGVVNDIRPKANTAFEQAIIRTLKG